MPGAEQGPGGEDLLAGGDVLPGRPDVQAGDRRLLHQNRRAAVGLAR